MTEPAEYLLRWRGRQIGPYSLQEINRLLDAHQIGLGHEIQQEGQWISLEEFLSASPSATALEAANPGGQNKEPHPSGPPNQSRRVPVTETPPPSQRPAVERSAQRAIANEARTSAQEPSGRNQFGTALPTTQPRKRLVYAALAILFGFLGIHNYYSRHWLTGVLQLLLSFATYLLGFGVFVPWLWAMVEAVVVREDGDGREMV
jgi:TM2 domain-containing membrane protein YozV